jgi:hypothetical protein
MFERVSEALARGLSVLHCDRSLERRPGQNRFAARAMPLDAVVRASAASDPDAARIRALHEGWRAEGYRAMLEVLRTKSGLRDGVSPERATQLLLMYIGDVYRILVHDFGWSHEDWIDWTVATVSEQVFARPV